jgi:hypothetical protein
VKHTSYWRLVRTWSLVLSLLSLPSARSLAQDGVEPPSYRETVREALSEYTAKNFPEARALFAEAHRLFPNARTLRGLGMTAFELRSYRESIGYLHQALDSKVKPLNESLRAETERLLARAERFVGKLNVSITPPEAEIVLDGSPLEPGTPQPLLLEVGEHQLEFRAEDYVPESRTLYVKGRESTTWSVVLNKVPVVAAPVAAPTSAAALQPEQVAAQAEAEPTSGPRYFSPEDTHERPTKRPVYKSPWLWTGVGAVVVAVVVTSVVIATRDTTVAAARVGDNTPPGGVFSALEGGQP